MKWLVCIALSTLLVGLEAAAVFNPATLAPNGFDASVIGNGKNEWDFREPQTYDDHHLYAHCEMEVNSANPGAHEDKVTGAVDFKFTNGGTYTEIKVNLTGFATDDGNWYHGFHIHEWGDLSDGCESAGSHYNPFEENHGAPYDDALHRHFGDLGNIQEDPNGNVNTYFTDGIVAIEGPFTVVGRAMVVHQKYDDLGKTGTDDSSTTGNAGDRLSCCVIGRSSGIHWNSEK